MNPSARPLVELADVEFHRDATSPDAGFRLRVPHFRLDPGERVVIAGPSGSGKSTFLDLLALLRPPAGARTFRLADADAAGLWSAAVPSARALRTRLRGRLIGYVLQTGGLLPYLNVDDNLRLPQHLQDHADPHWIAQLLDALSLTALRRRLPAQLSLGERQRVAVARALAHRPPLVLADEPTASLDERHGERVLSLLVSLCAQAGAGLVVVSHDTALTRRHGLQAVSCTRDGGATVIAR